MFDILHGICGLPRPSKGQPPPPSLSFSPLLLPPPKVAPTMWILYEALINSITASHLDKTVYYAQSVMSLCKL